MNGTPIAEAKMRHNVSPQDNEYYNGVHFGVLDTLERVESREVVTAEVAALQAMAAKPCDRVGCEHVLLDKWNAEDLELSVPCWATYTLEQTP